MIQPGATLGVLGGGQLGRMFAMAARRLGYRVAALDPNRDCPAAGVVDHLVCARLDDEAAWSQMAQLCAAVTVETENVPAQALEYLARHIRVAPDARALGIAQDRLSEKAFLSQLGLPVVPHMDVTTMPEQIPRNLLPGILKASRNGYDGKGQAAVNNAKELRAAFQQMGQVPCVLEARIELSAEISVILARSDDGKVEVFPVPLNIHRHGILDTSIAPAPLPEAMLARARTLARRVAKALDYRGVLCVEFFLLANGRLLINEIAPRPHNSGHFTLDACDSSQFEQQVRTLAGLPLARASLLKPAAMVNLLGDSWARGEPDWRAAMSHPGLRLHLYGKSRAHPGRKMGHITLLCASAPNAAERLIALRNRLSGKKIPEPCSARLPAEA